jgi:hypothetical protein
MEVRTVVSTTELTAWLNRELHNRLTSLGFANSGATKISILYVHTEIGEGECNWSPTCIPTGGVSVDEINNAIIKVVDDAQKQFNVRS